MAQASDPHNVNGRLYNQIAKLLDDLEQRDANEKVTIKERIAALIAVARIQTIFMTLRREHADASGTTGSTVRKYAGAFKADAGRRRAAAARAAAADTGLDDFADDDDDDAA